ncbi:MAG: hypothetical protein LUC92_09740 [Clostridiales bacterium]|nr:hypothetical protein [Clostridiales bacterium]
MSKSMKKFLKAFVFVIAAVFALLIAAYYILLIIFNGPYLTDNSRKKEFSRNYETISRFKDILENSEYSTITIRPTDYISDSSDYGYYYVNSDEIEGGKIEIENEKLLETLDYLFKKKRYGTINKYNNYIAFQLYADLDRSAGVVYSLDGETPDMQGITCVEMLSEKNWYYYETDINISRIHDYNDLSASY